MPTSKSRRRRDSRSASRPKRGRLNSYMHSLKQRWKFVVFWSMLALCAWVLARALLNTDIPPPTDIDGTVSLWNRLAGVSQDVYDWWNSVAIPVTPTSSSTDVAVIYDNAIKVNVKPFATTWKELIKTMPKPLVATINNAVATVSRSTPLRCKPTFLGGVMACEPWVTPKFGFDWFSKTIETVYINFANLYAKFARNLVDQLGPTNPHGIALVQMTFTRASMQKYVY